MALFKFRKGRDEQPAPSRKAKAPTVEAVRRRAMHRLIGAAVLVLAGVIGFPLIFDNQPRPIPVDLPIEIVDKATVKPLVPPQPAASVAAAPAAPVKEAAPIKEAAPVKESAPTPAKPPILAAPEPTPAPVATAKGPAAPTPAAPPPETRTLDAKKARALLEARPTPPDAPGTAPKAAAATTKIPPEGAKTAATPAAAADARFVVQVGAFADASKAREVRRKVESTGLKTYTQVVGTPDGDRTRVRVGPFSDRAEADKAAEKIRKLNLAAAILTL
ncbi:MAG: SPOR domain-containing protein [Burkholderiaceae bacterium]